MVYFITDGDHIKIGYSEDVKRRLLQLQTGSANKLKVVLIISGDKRVEAYWHKKFEKYRTSANNEWFKVHMKQLRIELQKEMSLELFCKLEMITRKEMGRENFKSCSRHVNRKRVRVYKTATN